MEYLEKFLALEGWGPGRVGRLIGRSTSAIRAWRKGERKMPLAVARLLMITWCSAVWRAKVEMINKKSLKSEGRS